MLPEIMWICPNLLNGNVFKQITKCAELLFLNVHSYELGEKKIRLVDNRVKWRARRDVFLQTCIVPLCA